MAMESEANLLWVSCAQVNQKYIVKPHRHEEYCHLLYVQDGEVLFFWEGEEIVVQTDEIFFANQGVLHGYRSYKDTQAKVYELKFVVAQARIVAALSDLEPIFPAGGFATAIIRQIVEECADMPLTSVSLTSYLMSLLFCITTPCRVQTGWAAQLIDTSGFSEPSVAIVRFLEQSFRQNISLQDIASATGFNPNYLCGVFKKDSGQTIGKCLTLLRIQKAAELVSCSDMTLGQICAAVGFPNVSHFNRIFKGVMGISPGKYRRVFNLDMIALSDEAFGEEA